MNVKVADLMREQVVTAQPHQTLDHVRGVLERNGISALPIVDTEDQPVGIVSSTDLLGSHPGGTPVSKIMTERVYTVPKYDNVSIAARVMRNHGIHRVVVTDEHKVVGILSAFDLLKLVEDHRFQMKPAPTPGKRKRNTRT
jgi:CBS domain-containing protein